MYRVSIFSYIFVPTFQFYSLLIHSMLLIPLSHSCSLKVPKMYKKCLRVSSLMKGKSQSTSLCGGEWALLQIANIGGNQTNPRIRILLIPSAKGLFEGRMSRQRSWKLLALRTRIYPRRRMNDKVANGMKMWKGNGNTTTLLFSLKGNFTSRKKRTNEHPSDGTLQQHSLSQVWTC